jgi:transposase
MVFYKWLFTVFSLTNKESRMTKEKAVAPVKVQKRIRKSFDDTFKVKVVLEALKESLTLAELASKYAVHPNQISTWKKHFLERSVDVFSGSGRERQELELLRSDRDKLVHQIGEQAVDIEFLKKNLKKLGLL